MPHSFLEVHSYDPKPNPAKIFVQCTYPQVSTYVYSFGSYRFDKQTDAIVNIPRFSIRYEVG